MRLVLILGLALLVVFVPAAAAGMQDEGDACITSWQGVSAPQPNVQYCIDMVMHDIDRVINGGP